MKKLLFVLAIVGLNCSLSSEKAYVNTDELKEQLISYSQSFQLAYISNNYDQASKFMSNEFETTVFNSNGTDLIVQTKENIENSGEGWDFGEFIMSNHMVTISTDQKTAVVVFNTDGHINFENGEQNVPYATRASQTWVHTTDGWKVMHSHWSPRIGSSGVPVE